MGRATINQEVDRRRILLGIAALMGGSLMPGSVAALTANNSDMQEPSSSPLTNDQFKTVSVIADIIIPETDTPGATGAGVPEYVNRALGHWLTPDETTHFLASFHQFSANNPTFLTVTAREQKAIIEKIDGQLDNLPAPLAFYRQLKELVLIGYYTSEVGATIELAYDPIPGGYVPFTTEDSVKAWATS